MRRPIDQKRYRAIAEYYDAECEAIPWLQHDVPFLLKHLPGKSVDVLELACGTGRVAIPLAQAGHRVVGVDYASDMLAIAKRKRDASGLSEKQLKLVEQDVLNLDLKQKFDFVAILFNGFLAFATLAEQDRLLQKIRAHLKPRGKFWLDIFQPNLAILATYRSRNHAPTIFHVPSLNRTVFLVVDVERDPAKQLQLITFRYKWFDEKGRERKAQTKFTLTFIMPRELQLLLERNGFETEQLWGDYDGSELDADSPRMIAMCGLK